MTHEEFFENVPGARACDAILRGQGFDRNEPHKMGGMPVEVMYTKGSITVVLWGHGDHWLHTCGQSRWFRDSLSLMGLLPKDQP